MLVISCFLHGMDPYEAQIVANRYFRPINPAVEERWTTAKILDWQNELASAVVCNKNADVDALLLTAREDAKELVCTAKTAYGSLLLATYIEGKTNMRHKLIYYMDDDYIERSFMKGKEELQAMRSFNQAHMQGKQKPQEVQPRRHPDTTFSSVVALVRDLPLKMTSPSVAALLYDFYKKNPEKYPLTDEEKQSLGIED